MTPPARQASARTRRRIHAIHAAAAMALVALATAAGEAHKNITSPFTFNDDVLPIVKSRCASCHVPGGAAPMSLLTHADSEPWAESIRLELVAGHMPPWRVENAARFRDVDTLSARELNVLLTWAAGGTPRGADRPADALPSTGGWPLGPPDLVLQPSSDFTLAEDVQDRTETFVLQPNTTEPRWIRAVDVMPGVSAVVRSATVSIVPQARGGAAPSTEQIVALWQPGAGPTIVGSDAGFFLPAGASMRLAVHYRKTWRNERERLTDRTRVGLYFHEGRVADVRAMTLAAPAGAAAPRGDTALTFTHAVTDDVRALSLYPDRLLSGARVAVTAVRTGGVREELIAFRPQKNWARRYVFREPVNLPRGTRLEVSVVAEDGSLLPPGAAVPAPVNVDDVRLTLDVVPGTAR